MENIAVLLILISFIALILGLIKPSIVLKWNKNKTRKQVLKTYGLLLLGSFIIAVIVMPKKNINNTKKHNKQSSIKHIQQKKEKTSKPPIYMIMEDTLFDEVNNKEIKAISIIWKLSNTDELTLILKKENFKKGYVYTGNHKQDEYYKKYLPNIRIQLKTSNYYYQYTPSIKSCSLYIKIEDINTKEKIAKISIKTTLATKDKNYNIQFRQLSQNTYIIKGKDFLKLEKLLK